MRSSIAEEGLVAVKADLCWLKIMAARLHSAVPPKRETRPAITSLHLLKLGQPLGNNLRASDAVQYRDGLIINSDGIPPAATQEPYCA